MNKRIIINVSAATLMIIPIAIGKIKAAKATIPVENETVACEIETETFETEKTTEYFTSDYDLGVRKDRYSFIQRVLVVEAHMQNRQRHESDYHKSHRHCSST